MISEELIACFNPFLKDGFECPVCKSNNFVELKPYGGVWCNGCNAKFEVNPTCDGIRKVYIRCFTEHVWKHKRTKKMAERYGTTVWEDDIDKISWLDFKVIRSIVDLRK